LLPKTNEENMAIKLTKTIYEPVEVNSIVLDYHKKREGEPPDGYHWQARPSRAGVIVEAVEVNGEPAKA